MQPKHVSDIQFTAIKLCVDGPHAYYCVYSRLVSVVSLLALADLVQRLSRSASCACNLREYYILCRQLEILLRLDTPRTVTRLQDGQSGMWFPAGSRNFWLLQNAYTCPGFQQAPLPPHFKGYWVLFPWIWIWTEQGVKLTSHVHPMPPSGTSGSVLLMPLCAVEVCLGTTYTFYIFQSVYWTAPRFTADAQTVLDADSVACRLLCWCVGIIQCGGHRMPLHFVHDGTKIVRNVRTAYRTT